MRGMYVWRGGGRPELYINDPDILSDVTEIAVKKLGYWSESRSRDERSLALFLRVRLYMCITHTHIYANETPLVENSIDQIAREKSRLHGRLGVFACSETVTTTMNHS